ncbi:signal peptidase II [Temperatibacter marinus]|uniref:Lipoprotein signal peptidase n=1 Tax=Temperatibacter marinus TaxID=1456591 RepID=A0AA52HBZ3_9PROT|nr:signal peptidase II [Temperatibacter marinus]WND04163.1 signal peptidase II [Temperatibacter marinus]
MLILILDQISKWWILKVFELPLKGSVELLPFLNFTMVWNKGISMGLITPDGDLGKGLLIVGTILIMGILLVWMRKSESKLEAYALAVVFGGAFGNLLDRFFHGAVVDFVHLHAGGYSFYVFNAADAAISLGVMALLLESFLPEKFVQRLQGSNKSTKTKNEE